MSRLSIVALAVSMAVAFGVMHNLITVQISPANFTIGHPRLIDTDTPLLLAISWGITRPLLAGLAVGIPLALVATAGAMPSLTVRQLIRPIAGLCVLMAAASLAGGLTGHVRARAGEHTTPSNAIDRVPEGEKVRFVSMQTAHAWAHRAGFVGGVALWGYTWQRRRRLAARGGRQVEVPDGKHDLAAGHGRYDDDRR